MPNPVKFRRLVFGQLVAVAGPDTDPPGFSSAEEGDVSNVIVAVLFDEDIVAPGGDYTLGVTIQFDAVNATITAGALQIDNRTVHYTVSASAEPDAAVTWAYSSALGDIEDLSGNALGDVAAQAVDNNVGEHWRFDHLYNSMQLAAL